MRFVMHRESGDPLEDEIAGSPITKTEPFYINEGTIEIDALEDIMKIVEEAEHIGINGFDEEAPTITIRDSWD